jgi:hypothetical protein
MGYRLSDQISQPEQRAVAVCTRPDACLEHLWRNEESRLSGYYDVTIRQKRKDNGVTCASRAASQWNLEPFKFNPIEFEDWRGGWQEGTCNHNFFGYETEVSVRRTV